MSRLKIKVKNNPSEIKELTNTLKALTNVLVELTNTLETLEEETETPKDIFTEPEYISNLEPFTAPESIRKKTGKTLSFRHKDLVGTAYEEDENGEINVDQIALSLDSNAVTKKSNSINF